MFFIQKRSTSLHLHTCFLTVDHNSPLLDTTWTSPTNLKIRRVFVKKIRWVFPESESDLRMVPG